MCISQLFNNASVSAFFGAFFAFILVYLNDKRRLIRKKKLLYRQIDVNKQQADLKRKTIRQNRNDLSVNNIIQPAPIFNFQVTLLKAFEMETLDLFKDNELIAFEGICFYLEATDGILNEVYEYSVKIKELVNQGLSLESDSDEMIKHKNNLLRLFNEAEANLVIIDKMCNSFLKKNYDEILAGAKSINA
ncbi:MAG: hypothetical protein JXA54_03355 [Candidatus Heimdallarchaeota archaeon]|nr:hypothetical protein [Candidatus Heimdallarchaeota archaeon]